VQKSFITRIPWWVWACALTAIAFAVAVVPSLQPGEGGYLTARLGNALTFSVFGILTIWFITQGVSRSKVFGLLFITLGLFILTMPWRIEGQRARDTLTSQALDKVLVEAKQGEKMPRADAIKLASQGLSISPELVDTLFIESMDIQSADPISTRVFQTAHDNAQADLDAQTAFSPDATATMRYGDVLNKSLPATVVPTAGWLIFTALSFLLGGALSIFVPVTLDERLRVVLTGIALLIPLPLVWSVLSAVVNLLAVGSLSFIPGIVWWVLGFGAYLGGMGWIAYSNRGKEGIVSGAWQTVNLLLVVPTALIVVAVGKETNILTIIAESLRLATPIVIGAISGLWSERSGVVNIAIEGMMLTGACFGFTALFMLDPLMPGNTNLVLFIAVLVAVLSSALMALLHAWLSITFKTDQIISGTVINILAIGLTGFVRRKYLLSTQAGRVTLPQLPIPGLSEIPLLGPILFNNKPIFYMMFVLLILTWFIIFHTRWGLRIRAVGEHPHAADTVGINVYRTRYIAVLISGVIAGLGGAWFSLETTGGFDDVMTSGRGFIALAAMIFGKWTPFGSFFGGLLFGFADALGTRFQILSVPVPSQFLQLLPYLVTILVLAGLVGRAVAPAADGKPYEK
jgi:ABC-type uncharacterized transport system permease subunit